MGAFLHDYGWLDADNHFTALPPSHEDVVNYAKYVVGNMIAKLPPGGEVTLHRHEDPTKQDDGRTFTMIIKAPIDGRVDD